jgi:hypothetical protein
VKLKALNIKDDKNTRFPYLIESQVSEESKELIVINMLKKDRKASSYSGIDMQVDLKFGVILVNWHPKTLNRLIRFFRYMKLERQIVEQEREKFFYDFKRINH